MLTLPERVVTYECPQRAVASVSYGQQEPSRQSPILFCPSIDSTEAKQYVLLTSGWDREAVVISLFPSFLR